MFFQKAGTTFKNKGVKRYYSSQRHLNKQPFDLEPNQLPVRYGVKDRSKSINL